MENAYWLHCMVLVWDWSEAQVMERDSWLSILEFITCTFFSTYSGMAAVIRRELLATASAVAERRGVIRCCIRGGGAYGVLHPRGRSVWGFASAGAECVWTHRWRTRRSQQQSIIIMLELVAISSYRDRFLPITNEQTTDLRNQEANE